MTKKTIFGLYGAGGFGKEVIKIARTQLAISHPNAEIYFVETIPSQNIVNGIKNISEEEFFSIDCDCKLFNIAIANSRARESIATRCLLAGAEPLTLISPSAEVYDREALGCGAIICSYSIITANVQVGKFFHSNVYSYVAHDCIIGNYVTFAPRVTCNGNIHIDDHVYVGASASVKPGSVEKPRKIGKESIIGMGAVVLKDVDPGTTIIGNPGRILSPK